MARKTNNKSSGRTRQPNGKSLKAAQKSAINRRIKQNRPAHKRVLLHPLTVLILLCILVFVVTWTYKALATTISAEVYAQPLTEGAVITDPADNATFSDQAPITVSGTCPDSSYVEVYVNDIFKGVGLCGTNHTFQIQVSLFSGSNTLLAQDFNVTDQAGPATSTVLVTLHIPSLVSISNPTSDSSSSGATAVTSPPPLLLMSNFHWQTFSTGSAFSWKMELEGGLPPYTVKVDWGDGQTSNYKFDTDPVFDIKHTYAKPGYYPIKTYSTDSKGDQKMMQLAALITAPGANTSFFNHPSTPIATTAKSSGLTAFFVSSKNWLWIAWPSLIIVALMMFSFWLGELQNKRVLLAKKRLSHRRVA